MAQEPEEKRDDVKESPLWPPDNGYPRDLLVNPKEGEEYECKKCHHLPRNVVEIACDVHETADSDEEENAAKMKIYCKTCLDKVLASNGNKCPITGHVNPIAQKNGYLRSAIRNYEVKCPQSIVKELRPSF